MSLTTNQPLDLSVFINLTTLSAENLTGNGTLLGDVDEDWLQHVTYVLLINIVICIIGTLTNTTALMVFSRPRHCSTMRSMLLFLSLAEVVLEVSAGISGTFNLLYYRMHRFYEDNPAAQIVRTVFSDAHITAMTVRNFWVAIIALKRWDATSKPLRPRFQKVSKARLAQLLFVLYVAFSLVLIPFYTMIPDDGCSQINFYFIYLVISNGFTFTVIAIFGILTIVKSGSVSRYVTTIRPSLRRRQRAVTRTIVTLLFTFLICEVSFLAIYILYYSDSCLETDYGIGRNPASILIAYMLTDVDSICNFIIYFFCYTPFKRRLFTLFQRGLGSIMSSQNAQSSLNLPENSALQANTDTCV